MGVTPDLKKQVFDNLESYLNVKLPQHAGARYARLHAGGRTRRDRSPAFCLGGNLFGSNPDSTAAARAIARLDQITYLNTTLNTGHAWGRAKQTLILPVLARDEEPEPTTQESMFNFVRMSDGGTPRIEGPRSEVDIIASLADRRAGADLAHRLEHTHAPLPCPPAHRPDHPRL